MTDPVTPTPTAVDPALTADPAPALEPTVLGGDPVDPPVKPDPADPADPPVDPAAPPADPAAVTNPPEKYELTAPDGFDAIDTDVLAEAEPVLKELNLTNDQANKLMPFAGSLVKKTLERAEAAITNRAVENRKAWSDAFDADPEIGGTNKDATIAAAAKFFDHYGLKRGEGLRQLLDESGLGNHPDLIRAFAAVGRDLAEGSFERGAAASTPKAPEQKLYGAEFQPKG